VYRHNFPDVNHSSGNICGLKPEVLTKKGIEAIFMSPPCQPFTRQGLQKDLQVEQGSMLRSQSSANFANLSAKNWH
jgi:tRNA (cytosine38-C5)-methyltransferase